MKKLENMINTTLGSIVILLFLLGSVEEVIIPVVATLVTLLFISVSALVFLLQAKKRYMANKADKAIEGMMLAAKRKTSSAA